MRNINIMLKQYKKMNFSVLPTPLYKLKNISNIKKTNIYCKRDDLTGFAFGGNKTRKLDYLLGYALQLKVENLICIGAVQSNFCRMATGAAAAAGLTIDLVLGGEKPEKATGNLLLDKILGATIHYIDSEDWNIWEEEAGLLNEKLLEKNIKSLVLPVGGSIPIGTLGYVRAFIEIMNDLKNNNIEIDTIIHSSSSGGTQAGLIVGKSLYNWSGNIIGISVAKSKTEYEKEIYSLAQETGKLLNVKIDRNNVIVDDNYIGESYGIPTNESKKAIELFAQKEGIFLDNVYTGKAAAALLDYASIENKNLLFLHTGGNIELFR